MIRDRTGCARPASLLFIVLSLAACATPGPATMGYGLDESAAAPVWPQPPDPPRYRLVGELVGEPNFSRHEQQGLGSRVFRWVVGLGSKKRTPLLLQQPQSGYVGEDGRIYVADVSKAAVFVFDPNAGKLMVWRAAGKVAQFATPVGIAAGANGETLVVDADLRQVVRLDPDGKPVGAFGQAELERPVGIARDAARGRVFVADAYGHDVRIYSDGGELIGTIGHRGEGEGEFNSPTYLAYAGDRLYVTDTMNSRIQVFDAEGRFVRQFGRRGIFVGDLPRPKGIALDSDGHVYVVESYYDHLLVFNDAGELLLAIGGSGTGVGEFYLPAGVWTDHRNRIYVADAFNGRVMIFQYLGAA
jgi:DNA-binding beta-propeller fold protein YncE